MWERRLRFRFEAMLRNSFPRFTALIPVSLLPQYHLVSTKVVRELTSSNTSPMEPIEIPPPRAKRKPMYPYPRKLVHQEVKNSPNLELPRRSSPPKLSVLEPENQSPASVLSVVASEAFGYSGSNTPNSSLSPCSSADPAQFGVLTLSKPNSSAEENGSLSAVLVTTGSVPEEKSPKNVPKLGLQSQDFAKEFFGNGASTQSLKLFGTTVLVTHSQRPASLSAGTCKSFASDVNGGKPLQLLPLKLMHTEPQLGDKKCAWRHLQDVGSGPDAHCYMQWPEENSNVVEAAFGDCLPCWSLFGGTSFSIKPCNQQKPLKIHINSGLGEVQDKGFQKEGSWTGSNSKSVNEEDNFDGSSDAETPSCLQSQNKEEKEPNLAFELKSSENSAFSVVRASHAKHKKGFVPYKKRMVEMDNRSLAAITGDERKEQRLRYCF